MQAIYGMYAYLSLTALESCNNCEICNTEMMGIKSPEQELCGDELKNAEKTPGMVCEDK
jgi:hypothetical protein